MPKKKPVDLAFAFRRPPELAMKYLRSKGYTLSWDWHDTLGEAHASAFTVAHVARMDILQDIRGAVDEAIADGQTFREFRKNLEPTLKKKGWWGKQKGINPKTGVEESFLAGSPHRLRTIYETNMKLAYNAGREESFQRNKKNRPYGQLVAVMDSATRDEHAKLHEKTFPLDDPFWDRFTPPIDYRCRCRKRALSGTQVKRMGVKVLSSKGRMIREDRVISKRTGEVRPVWGYKLPSGGKVFPMAGFDHNQWKAAYQPDLEKYDYDIAKKYVEGTVTGPAFKRFFSEDLKDGGMFSVGVMSAETRGIVGAGKAQGVRIYADRKTHVRKDHPETTANDFLKVQDMLDNGEILTNPGKEADVLLARKIGDEHYLIPLQVGKRGGNLLSFYRLDQGEVNRESLRKRGKVLRKERN